MWLSEKLTVDGHAVALLTGDLTISQRICIFDRFRDGEHRVLISTNVLARGIQLHEMNSFVKNCNNSDIFRTLSAPRY